MKPVSFRSVFAVAHSDVGGHPAGSRQELHCLHLRLDEFVGDLLAG
jgi:hypothetical protein